MKKFREYVDSNNSQHTRLALKMAKILGVTLDEVYGINIYGPSSTKAAILRRFTKTIDAVAVTISGNSVVLLKEGLSENTFRFFTLMCHEFTHIMQYREAGFIKFSWRYYTEYFKNIMKHGTLMEAYWNLSAEKEATDNENQMWAGESMASILNTK